MTKKELRSKNIFRHGQNLISIFALPATTDPMQLCKRLHRLEAKAHKLAEDYCNGAISEHDHDMGLRSTISALDKLLNYKAQNIPVFINGDPRGYALKIDGDYVRTHRLQIYRDWGGYGIICPEF